MCIQKRKVHGKRSRSSSMNEKLNVRCEGFETVPNPLWTKDLTKRVEETYRLGWLEGPVCGREGLLEGIVGHEWW